MLKHQVFFLCYRRSIYFYKAELCDFLKNVKLKKILLGIAYNILYNNLVMQFPYRRLFMKTLKIDLCKNWQLATITHGEHKDYTSLSELQKDGVEIISATVPGTVELDLKNAGKITKDLFFGTNPWEINSYTQMLHCYYFTTFNTDRVSGAPRLVFEGLDCFYSMYRIGCKHGSISSRRRREREEICASKC